MRGVKQVLPLFIVCANPACGALKQVKNQSEQRRRRFCSPRCNGAASGGVQHMTREARLAAAMKSKDVRRRAALVRWQGMSPLQIAREAYCMGWKAGARAVRRRLGVPKKEHAA